MAPRGRGGYQGLFSESMSIENPANVFDALPSDAELISRYKPEFYKRGGDHLVYRVPGHPELVVKASWRKIKDILYECYTKGITDEDSMKAYAETYSAGDVWRKNAEARNLWRCFGSNHALQERRYLMQVPISPEILDELFRDDYIGRKLPESARIVRNVWTHVAVQKFSKEAEDPGRLAFSFGNYPENISQDEVNYLKMTHALLEGQQVDEKEFLAFQDISSGKFLTRLVECAHTDLGLKEAVIDFVQKAISYVRSNGQILALAGEDNVIFFKKNGSWGYKLIDAMPVPTQLIYKEAQEYLARQPHGTIDKRQRGDLIRSINFARAINGTAAALGIPDRITLPNVSDHLLKQLLGHQT